MMNDELSDFHGIYFPFLIMRDNCHIWHVNFDESDGSEDILHIICFIILLASLCSPSIYIAY